MNKKLNKLVTNYPVELNEKEIENLSATLAPVIAACGGGGGTGGKIYTGTGFVNVNNTTNQIGLTEDANDKLNKEYVEYNEYSTAIANRYTKTQTNALLDEKQDTLEFEYDENNKVSAINGSALAGQGGGTGDYTAGIDLKIENNIISVDTNGNPNNTASNTRNFVEGSWTEASGYNSHAEGMATTAYGYAVHAQGMWTKFSSSKWWDDDHPTPIDIYWAAGAGATVEGYCNATTSCPMSGTKGQSDYGPIHGGILKVIGNGNVVHDQSVDPDAHNHTLQPSDALIIFKDGCISAAGNISANGIELGAGGTSYQGRKGVNVGGGYVELTQDAYESVTSVPNISNDVEILKTASGDWNKVSDKLDTTAFSTVSSNFLTDEDLDEYAKLEQLENVSGKLLTTAQYANDSATFLTAIPDTYALKDDIPKTVAQLIDSGNYYQKTETSSKEQLSNEFAKYVTSSNVSTQGADYVMTTTGWKVLTLPGGGMTQVIHDETLTGQGNDDNSKLGVAWSALSGNTINSAKSATVATEYYDATQTDTVNIAESINTLNDDIEYVSGQVDNKVNKPTSTQTGKLVYDSDTSAWSDIGLDDYVPYSATELVIGSGNEVDYQYNNVKNNFVQGTNNIVTNNNSETFVQGKANKLFTSQDSLVQGYGNSATNYYCLAQGSLNDATLYSLTQGSNNTANNLSQAAGQTNSAWTASVAFGNANTAKDYSVAQGTVNSADTTAFAQGSANTANYGSFAQGWHNSAFYYALAQGNHNSADYGSFAQGQSNKAQSYSIAHGWCNSASNDSVAQGSDNYANYYSQAFGFGLSIEGNPGGNGTYFSGGLAIGTYNQTSAGVALVIGDGHSNGADATPTRSDSFIIYADGSVSAKGDISANGVKLGPGGGTSFTGVTTAGSISGDGLTNPLGLITSAENALTSVSSKVDIPDTTQTVLNNNYLIYSTLTGAGTTTGWMPLSANYYSKSEANGTFVATAYIDTTTLSGNGKSVSTKLGVKTDVIATKDYVNSSFLPTSGGTVSGSVQFSVASGKNILAVASAATLIGASRQTTEHYGVDNTALGTTWVGVGGDGMHQGFIKYTDGGDVGALDSNSTIQLNLKPSTNKFDSIQVQINGGSVGYLIPAVTSTTTAGLTNDGILHIILES